MNKLYEIKGELSIADVQDILYNKKRIKLSAESKSLIESCRNYLDEKMAKGGDPIYGVNTGFGSLCDTVISNNDLQTLQENLLRSHACGAGEMVDLDIIKIMLLLKIQSLSYGNSGVSLATVDRLIEFFNNDIYPVIYDQGSLGASGDLAPLAHLALPLIGEGMVWVQSDENDDEFVMAESQLVLNELGWQPIKLQSKEGLALINGTQFMCAYGLYVLLQSKRIFGWANFIAATSIDAFDARIEPFHAALHQVRPHLGQTETAKTIMEILHNSEMTQAPKKQVQDPYSFRCIPQVHGASFDAFAYFEKVVLTEMNSVTDNPNIFPDLDTIISGGNFHGQPLALAFDFWAIALAELGNISERRTFQLVSGLRHLPPFLITTPGLNSGFMIPQYTAASIVSQNKQLCTPASVDSIVSSNGQEDHVSMGANAATKLLKICKNLETILAIEYMNAAQAIEFRRPLKSAILVEEELSKYRSLVPRLENDRYLYDDIQNTIEFMKSHTIEINITQ
ncbi:MAG: histidine ammonia-lyase [bacterium]|nr:histidine ammonia-lyase [bacterium]